MNSHPWDVSPSEATEIQKKLAAVVQLKPFPGKPLLVAGADISFNKYSPRVYAGIVVQETASLCILEKAGAEMDVSFPYIPGFLSFREIPPLLAAWRKLKTRPDVIVVDGQGIAHPRRLGIASHLGVLLGIPTIGCAKSLLVGRYGELALEAGAESPLWHRDEQVGMALRTKKNVKPVFVSPGHLMDSSSAVRILLALRAGYRLPEPTRQAHLFVNELRVAAKKDAA